MSVAGHCKPFAYMYRTGCYILRPWAYGVWEHIHSWFDCKIKVQMNLLCVLIGLLSLAVIGCTLR